MSANAEQDPQSLVARMRDRLAGLVAQDGLDAHQVAAAGLAWAAARTEAAAACQVWAARSGDQLAALIAAAAREEAIAQVSGRSLDLAGLDHERLVAIHRAWRPVEDLGLDPEHALLRASLRRFTEREVRPVAQAIHRSDLDVPEAVIRGVAQLGLFGLSVPEEYGGVAGAEPDLGAMLIATEELSRASLAAAGSLMTRPEILVRALLTGGTEAQRQEWLPAIASGARMVAVAVTEPGAGSDVAAIECRARARLDGGWEITGTKLWCTFAGRSELLMVLCRTSDDGHRGLSLFVLEKPPFTGLEFEHLQPEGGALRGRAIPTIGYRGLHTFELAFERYRAPAGALVGGEAGWGRGFHLQMEGFAAGRLQTAARAVGVMQAALEASLAYARERRVFGQVLAQLQLPEATLGRMIVRLVAARQLAWRAAADLQARGGGRREAGFIPAAGPGGAPASDDGQMACALAKLYASAAAEQVTRDAAQLHGAMGYGEESDVARYFLDARVLPVFEGTEEVLALRVIARRLLGAG